MRNENSPVFPSLDGSFQHNFLARALPRPILAFGRGGDTSLDLAIEVTSPSEAWTAVFAESGALVGRAGLFSCPSPDDLCVLTGCAAYVFNTTRSVDHAPLVIEYVVDAIPVVEASMLVLVRFDSAIGLGRNGVAWRSKRLCDDELSLTRVTGSVVGGRGFLHGKYIECRLDSATGKILT